jgi:integrase
MASLTCLRRQEILDITWDDVDFEEQYFVILEPKGGKGEVKKPQLVPFTDYTEALFKKRKEQTKEIANPYVFYSQFKSDEPMTAQNIYVHSRITGLVMCMFDYKYQRQGREENKKAPIPKAIHPCNLNQQSLTELRKLLDEKKIDIDGIGMHMHDLRRTTGNVAEYLGMTRGTVETMLNHTGKTTATRHYIETQVEPFRKALQICNEYVDNRIAEYLYSETAGLQDETTFQSPILTYLRAEGDAVDKDEYYDNYGGFEELLGKKQSRTKSRKKFIK